MDIEEVTKPEMLVIRSEEEAWAALDSALNDADALRNTQLSFEGWPSFKLDMSGRDWHSTVPTRIMPALLEVQRDLHRAYVSLRYNEPNLSRLRAEERDALEVVVKVDEGSSAFDAELWDQLTVLAQAALTRMNGTETVIAVIGVGLLITSPVMWKAWLSARVKEKEINAELETNKAELVARVELSAQETARLELMARAAQVQPTVHAAQEDAQATANQLLKTTRPGDTLERAGVPISTATAHALAQPERERAKEVQIQGVFSILGNRTDKGDGFRITVRGEDGRVFNTDVPLGLPYDQQQVIQRAEWSKGRVNLWVEADELRGAIQRAVVVRAEAASTADRPKPNPPA